MPLAAALHRICVVDDEPTADPQFIVGNFVIRIVDREPTPAVAHNEELVRKLGASQVIDHCMADVIDWVAEALLGKTLVGAFHATGNLADTFAVVIRAKGPRFGAVGHGVRF